MFTTILYSLLVIIPALLIFTAVAAIKSNMSGKAPRRASRINFATFAALVAIVGVMSVNVLAENAPETAAEQPEQAEVKSESTGKDGGISTGLGLLAAALVTGLAGIGGGLAVAAGAPAAIAATSEDPKSFGKSIIFVALGESIALYGVVISILILQKV